MRWIDVGWAARVAGLASLVGHQAVSSSYGPPRLMLAHPAPGVSVPSDKATVVFHYASGDASDPLDLRSFTVLVDGVDRTSHFRATPEAAWGTIVHGGEKGIRAHEVRARVCTIRGACAEIGAVVTVVASGTTPKGAPEKARWAKFIDIALEVLRRLLKP